VHSDALEVILSRLRRSIRDGDSVPSSFQRSIWHGWSSAFPQSSHGPVFSRSSRFLAWNRLLAAFDRAADRGSKRFIY